LRSYLKLAHRIGQYKPEKGDSIEDLEDETIDDASDDSDDDSEDETISDTSDDIDNDSDDEVEVDKKKKKKHKKKKHHKQHEKNKVWLRFVKRAFVGTLEEEDLRTFNEDEVLIPEFREEL
jgi:endopolyphosphatase